MSNPQGYAYRRLADWTSDRGQSLVVSEGAAAQFVVLEDPRLGEWVWDDTMTAVVCHRRTLPWLPEPGSRIRALRVLGWQLRAHFILRLMSIAAWADEGAL